MQYKRKEVIILVLLGLTSGLSGILGNVASNLLPPTWKPFLWLSWPLFFVFISAGIGLAVWQMRTKQSSYLEYGNETLPQHAQVHAFPSSNSEAIISQDPAPTRCDQEGDEFDGNAIQILHKKVIRHCSLSDIKDLCFAMGIDYDNYPNKKCDFVRDLLIDLEREGRIEEFVAILRREKSWVLQ